MAAGVPQLVQGCAMPIDRLEIGLRRWDHHEVRPGRVEGAVAADAEVDAGGADQAFDPRLDQTWRRRRCDGRDLLGQAFALRGVEDREALQEGDRLGVLAGLAGAALFVVGDEAVSVDDGRAALALTHIAAETDTESGAGPTKKVHILVKPTRPDLVTNLVINTDRRTYLLELRSTEKTYMASVSWQYPEDQLIALRQQNASVEAAAPIASGVDLASINFRYAIEGDSPAWRPLRAFDDGQKVFIEFPSGIRQGEMPPLFVIGPAGGSELVNYRVRGNYYIVDRLFAAAELRLGDKDSERRVRIIRTDGRPRS
jgi:P-type conjugative transfer protein TrbG